jgi:DNA invertase Pin-like site-specific DNA recombinase
MSLRFIRYCRKSSQGKSKQAESISAQETILNDVAERDHLNVAYKLSEARSAKKPHIRPVFNELLELINIGKADAILCWHLNRLFRNPFDSGQIQQLLQDGKIRCIRTPERDYYPEDHALLMAVESSMANQYVRDLKRDVQRGARDKALRGWYPYKPKAGYLVDAFTHDVLPDPNCFPLLKRAWELMLTRTFSVPQVLSRLNSWGYRSPRTKSGGGKPMNKSSLYRMFKDPFYKGTFVFEGETLHGKHQPMISLAEYKAVQLQLGNSEHAKPQLHIHPYAGMIHCGVCGCLITAETHIKRYKTTGLTRSYTYYHCTGRRGCRKLSVLEGELEEQIIASLNGCRLDPFFIEWALGCLQRNEQDQASIEGAAAHSASTGEQVLRRKLENLFSMRENGEISREEFIERRAHHLAALNSLQDQKERKNTKRQRDRQTINNLLCFSRDGYDAFTEGNPEGKRLVARAFAVDYVLTLGKLEIMTHPGLDLIRMFEPQKNRDSQSNSGDHGMQLFAWRAMWAQLLQIVADSDQEFEGLPESLSSLPSNSGAPKLRATSTGWQCRNLACAPRSRQELLLVAKDYLKMYQYPKLKGMIDD